MRVTLKEYVPSEMRSDSDVLCSSVSTFLYRINLLAKARKFGCLIGWNARTAIKKEK